MWLSWMFRSPLLGGRRTVWPSVWCYQWVERPKFCWGLAKQKHLNPTKGWNENILRSSKLQQKVWIHKERNYPLSEIGKRSWFWVNIPILLHWWKDPWPATPKFGGFFLFSVFGAMINKPTHGSGWPSILSRWYIHFFTNPLPFLFSIDRPRTEVGKGKKSSGLAGHCGDQVRFRMEISISLIHGGSPKKQVQEVKGWLIWIIWTFKRKGWGLLLFELEKTWIAFFQNFRYQQTLWGIYVIERSLVHR